VSFKDKVAVVTGGASGMGAATAWRLARDGAAVLIADLNTEAGEQTSKEIQAGGGQAEFFRTDVSGRHSIKEMVDRAVERFGKLNLAANVAGIPQQPTPLVETTLELWDRTHAVNDRGLFLCLQAQIPRLLDAGGGAIVNVLSLNGLRGVLPDDRLREFEVRRRLHDPNCRKRIRRPRNQGERHCSWLHRHADAGHSAPRHARRIRGHAAKPTPRHRGRGSKPHRLPAFDEASYVTGTILPVDGGWLNG
jgi:NAD(P)-dependent dehydrogenase (short-subunit alcohol dehydrogenase family)